MISSFCNFGNCVQVDPAPDGGVYVRRRVTGDGAMAAQLPFTRAEFRAFVLGVKAGEFDDLTDNEPLRAPESLPRVAPGNPDTPCTAVTSDLRAQNGASLDERGNQ